MERRLFVASLAAGLPAARRASAARGEQVLVFAAASLTDALREIGAGFEEHDGHAVVFSFGGSNDLARQIRAGAPAQVFVSADAARMDELEQAGLVRRANRVDLLSNRLAVVVPAASSGAMHSVADLASVRRLAIADPEAVPAGLYARQWLQRLGLWDALRGRVIPTLDVRAALAAVESEAADAGVVYRTDAAVSDRVRIGFEVPAEEAPRIVYPAALVGDPGTAARAFFHDLRSRQARATFLRLGFEVLWTEAEASRPPAAPAQTAGSR